MGDDAARTTQQARGARSGREARERLDLLLVAHGLAPSRERARALIMAREVRVDGRTVDKAGTLVPRDAAIALSGPAAELRYVSRGGLKLERALDAFGLSPAGRVALDVGASTGGFTDVLLRRGAERIYAIDVGRGQLAWALRQDPRVVVMDRTNVRHLETLPLVPGPDGEPPVPPSCAVIDVSFISLRLVLPRVAALLGERGGWIVALVKPQFEAGRAEADRGAGVISNPAVHRRVLRDLLDWIAAYDVIAPGPRLAPREVVASPIAGREGNHEYLLWLDVLPASETAQAGVVMEIDDAAVERAVGEAFEGEQ